MDVRELDSVWTGQSARCHRLHPVASGFQTRATRWNSRSARQSADGRKHCGLSRFQVALQIGIFWVFTRRESERSRNSGPARRLRAHCVSRTRRASELLDGRRAPAPKWRFRYPPRPRHGRFAKWQVDEHCSAGLGEGVGPIPQFLEFQVGPRASRRPEAPKEHPTGPSRSLCFGGGAACGSSGRCALCARADREMAGGRRTCWRTDRSRVRLGCIGEGRLHHARGGGLHQPAATAWRQTTAATRSLDR